MIVQERLGRRKLEARAGIELAREKGIAARLAAPQFASVTLDDAVRLGAIAAALVRAGSGKLTFLTSEPLKDFGPRIARLIVGKRLPGVVPIVGEPVGRKDAYGTDRLFISLGLESEAHDLTWLAEPGNPVMQWKLGAPEDLAGEVARWEIAVATMEALLDGEPPAADSPPEASPGPSLRAEGLQLFAAADLAQILRGAAGTLGPRTAVSPAGWVAALLALADPGDYVALLPEFAQEAQSELSGVQGAIRNATRLACTSGAAPRLPNGLFLQLTAGGDAASQAPLHGLRALRIHAEDGDPRKLIETLYAAVKLLAKS